MPSTLFSLSFFFEIAVFGCFCSLGSCKLLTSLLILKLRIELMRFLQSVGQFIALSLKFIIYIFIHFSNFSVFVVLFVKL